MLFLYLAFMNIQLKDMAEKVPSDMTFQQENIADGEKIYGVAEYAKKIWDLGVITYGGPMSHIGIFRKRLVQEMSCIKDQKFVQLLTICQSLPGPTSTQLLTAISMYATSSFLGGVVAFTLFSLPAFIAMFAAVLYLQDRPDGFLMKYVLPGFRVVAVAVILQAFVGLFRKITKEYVMIAIVFVSAAIYYVKPTTTVILLEFLVAGILGYFYAKVPESTENVAIPSRFTSKVYGLKNLIIFFIILFIALVSLPHLESRIPIIFASFYKIGSLVIGGGHVILPIMYSQFQAYNFITEQQFYNGFSLISIMPGPMFNLCIYVGGLITNSIWGALAAFAGLYLPCFLFIMFILPYWQLYRKQTKIKGVISGICSASIGLILTASIILYRQELQVMQSHFMWFILITLVIVLSYGLLHYNFPVLLVFVLGDLAYGCSLLLVERL